MSTTTTNLIQPLNHTAIVQALLQTAGMLPEQLVWLQAASKTAPGPTCYGVTVCVNSAPADLCPGLRFKVLDYYLCEVVEILINEPSPGASRGATSQFGLPL